MCEAYTGLTPRIIEEHTLDQIYCLAIDAKLLKLQGSGRVTLSVQEAVDRGIIPSQGIGSVAQRVREQQEEERQRKDREHRREKKRRRREQTEQARKSQQQPEN